MNLQQRIQALVHLGHFMLSDAPNWLEAKEKAERENGWFTQDFIQQACREAATAFLDPAVLAQVASDYQIPVSCSDTKVGLVMAGNIPLVGLHDWICVFLSGQVAHIKLSAKDRVLLPALLHELVEAFPEAAGRFAFKELLKDCQAYIATGSNNSARYFEYYFSKYPHIIRKNRTSVAVLTGQETLDELGRLADDIHMYFGMGCRNVTHLYVPREYDFVPLIQAANRYAAFRDHNKYKNNYDYQLAVLLLNHQYYMSSESILLVESTDHFSPIAQVHYCFYDDLSVLLASLSQDDTLQCRVGAGGLPFGAAQSPRFTDYADGVDTLAFLQELRRP